MIDMNKKYRTRDGREVRILSTNSPVYGYPVVVCVKPHASPNWSIYTLTEEGRRSNSGRADDHDLVEVKPKLWIKGKIIGYTKDNMPAFAEVFTRRDDTPKVYNANCVTLIVRLAQLKGQGYTVAVDDIDMEIDQD